MQASVLIAVANKGTVRAETMMWALRAFSQLAPHAVVYAEPHPQTLQHVRSLHRVYFLQSQCTHMFILDSDCVPQDRTIQQLLAYDLPFISAPHMTVRGSEVGMMVLDRAKESYVQHHPTEGLQGPDVVVGCAGMLLRRDVLEKVGPFFCRYNEEGKLTKTEDFDYCDRAHALGYEVWAACDLVQQHKLVLTV